MSNPKYYSRILSEKGIDWNRELLEHAIHYAQRGWKIIPLHTPVEEDVCSCYQGCECTTIGKHPRIADWKENCSSDVEQIKKWWSTWPDANIGIATGEPSGVVVVDADGATGKRVLVNIEEDMPYTLVSRSGEGVHYYYKWPGIGVKNKVRVLPGVDSRGDGGYIIAPPSLHKKGYRYEWIDNADMIDIPTLPKWWLSLVNAEKENEERDLRLMQIPTRIDPSGIPYAKRRYAEQVRSNEINMLRSTPIGRGLRNTALNRTTFTIFRLVSAGYLDHHSTYDEIYNAATNGIQMKSGEVKKTMQSAISRAKDNPRVIA